jgi:hypothetical protein
VRFTIFAFVLISLLTGCASQDSPAAANSSPASSECTFCPTVSPKGCTLCVESNPLLTVDKDGVTSGTIKLCNRSTMPITLALDVSDFYAKDLQGTLYPLSTARSLAAASATNDPVVNGTSPLAPNSCVDVKIDASKIWQAGLAKADLKNGTDTLVPLNAVRYLVPFNLKVEGPTPEVVNLGFTRGRQSKIRLRNEDGMAYRFLWRLELGESSQAGEGFVPANGLTAIPVALASSNFSFLESGFLRSGDRKGTLTLSFQPDASFSVLPLPQKQYPVNARLSFFGDTFQRIANYALVLLVLLAGIFISLLVNHALPLQKKRVEVKLRLAALEGRLAGLGGVIDTRTLNLLRVEKKRLREALSELQPLIPQTAVDLPKLEARIDWLVQRTDLTSGTGDLLEAINAGSNGLALPEADAIRDHCREVLQIVGKTNATPEEIASAQKHLNLAAAVLEGADERPSDISVQALIKQLEKVQNVPKDDLKKPAWQPFAKLFTSLTGQPVPKADEIDRSEYIRETKLVAAAELIVEFVKHVESSPSDEVRQKRMDRAPELVKALEPGPDESIAGARELVRQVEQNVTRGDLVTEIMSSNPQGCRIVTGKESDPKRVMWIEVDPPTPFTYQMVTFRVRFDRSALDCAAAQNEIQCKWFVCTSTPNMAQASEGKEEKRIWDDAELPGAPAERRLSASSGQPTGWLIGSYFVGEGEWKRILKKPTSEVKRAFRKAADVFGIRSDKAATDEGITYTVKASFPDLGKEVQSEPVRLEETRAYVESRTVLAVASLVITILIVAFGLLAGAQEKLQSLDWVSGVIAVLVLGFGADTLKNLITKT